MGKSAKKVAFFSKPCRIPRGYLTRRKCSGQLFGLAGDLHIFRTIRLGVVLDLGDGVRLFRLLLVLHHIHSYPIFHPSGRTLSNDTI